MSIGRLAGMTLFMSLLLPVWPAAALDIQQIRMIVAYPPGSGADTAARFFARKLSDVSGKTVIVENRSGANAHLATLAVMKSKPDGQTALIHSTGAVLGNPLMMREAKYNPTKDIEVAALMTEGGFMLAVSPDQGIGDVRSLIERLKSKGDKASYGSANSSSTISARMFLKSAGVQAVEVNYKSSADAVQDLRSGLIDFAFIDGPLAAPQQKAGRVKILATTQSRRVLALPDVPTMIESGFPGNEYSLMFGIWLPKGTPDEILQQYNSWAEKIMAQEETRTYIVSGASSGPVYATLQEARVLVNETYERWRSMISDLGIQPK